MQKHYRLQGLMCGSFTLLGIPIIGSTRGGTTGYEGQDRTRDWNAINEQIYCHKNTRE